MKIRKLRKLIQAKLGWPDTHSGRTETGGYDDYETGRWIPRGSMRWFVASWNKAWKGHAAKCKQLKSY